MKYGLKLWSTNRGLFKEAVGLFKKREIDFIELYIAPGSFAGGNFDILTELKGVPTVVHASHETHGFNVFELNDLKIAFFKKQIGKTASFLNSEFIVVHAGVGDSRAMFKKNIQKINLTAVRKKILIENMPKVGTENELCFGYSLEQLKFIKDCGFALCLDFSHAIKSAISQKIDYKKFVEKLISELNPSYFHICNGRMNVEIDEHRDLFDGEFDIKWLKEKLILLEKGREIYLVFETPKSGKGLENDVKNINYFRNL